MKKIFTIILVLGLSEVLFSQGPVIKFEKEVHDFGVIKEVDGEVSTKFYFTNSGNVPLIINDVVASCGCTTPEWPKKPLMPGEKSSIIATYNPKGRPGKFEKSITISSNATADGKKIVIISGEVIPSLPSRPKE